MLTIDRLGVTLGDFALGDISLTVSQGEYFVLLGPSGAGKSLLLELLAGMIRPDSGRVTLGGEDITSLPINRRQVGLAFQKPALFPHMTVAENIAYGLRGLPSENRRRKVRELADRMGIGELLDHRPGTLSGGEAQRVSLARMLAVAPRVLLLDEPLSSLDSARRDDLKSLLRTLNREGQTILHVTHDYEEAFSLAGRVGILHRDDWGISRLEQVGPPREVFDNPRSSFVARFVGWRNVFEGRASKGAFFPDEAPHVELALEDTAAQGRGLVIIPESGIRCGGHEAQGADTMTGTLADVAPSPGGVEIRVDAGLPLSMHLTEDGFDGLGVDLGDALSVEIPPRSVRFFPAPHPSAPDQKGDCQHGTDAHP